MDPSALRKLSRAELQKLAKAHNIKANLKSEAIIKALLQLPSHHTPPTQLNPSAAVKDNLASPESPAPNPTNPNKGPIPTTAGEIVDDVEPPVVIKQEPPEDPVLGDRESSTFSYYPDTPASTPERVYQPCHDPVLCDVAEMMSLVSNDDQHLLDCVLGLRVTTDTTRRKTIDLRAAIRAERSRRERLEKYLTYWMDVRPTWEPHEIWGDRMRVDPRRPYGTWQEYESDDEPAFERDPAPEGWLRTLKPNARVPPHYQKALLEANGGKMPKPTVRHNPDPEYQDFGFLDEDTFPAELPIKRPRQNDDDDAGNDGDDEEEEHRRKRKKSRISISLPLELEVGRHALSDDTPQPSPQLPAPEASLFPESNQAEIPAANQEPPAPALRRTTRAIPRRRK